MASLIWNTIKHGTVFIINVYALFLAFTFYFLDLAALIHDNLMQPRQNDHVKLNVGLKPYHCLYFFNFL